MKMLNTVFSEFAYVHGGGASREGISPRVSQVRVSPKRESTWPPSHWRKVMSNCSKVYKQKQQHGRTSQITAA